VFLEFGAAAAGHAMVVVAIVVTANRCVTPLPEVVWIGGVVERGSIVTTSTGSRFSLHPRWGLDRPVRSRLAVFYEGDLPKTVCDGIDVAIEGRLFDDHFEAITIHDGGQSKYDPCRRWHCFVEAEKPSHCQHRNLGYQ
jgi:cytochrome c-type biogenesis protein CcmE